MLNLDDGDVIVNLVTALSAPDLYWQSNEAAKSKSLTEENIPSFSWFKFQFWPKDLYANSGFNYSGRLKIRYIVQKYSMNKVHEDDQYCGAIFNYLKEFSVCFRNHCAMVSTDDKNKINLWNQIILFQL